MYRDVLMDLSKDFDCLPYQLLINKLDAFNVFQNYLVGNLI